jgi:hypothetical protein
MSVGEEWLQRLSRLPGFTEEERGRLLATLDVLAPEQKNRNFPPGFSDIVVATCLRQKFLSQTGRFSFLQNYFFVLAAAYVIL